MSEPRISSHREKQPSHPGQVSFGIMRMSGEIIWMSCDRDCSINEIITFLVHFHQFSIDNDHAMILGFEDGPINGSVLLMDIIQQLTQCDFIFNILAIV